LQNYESKSLDSSKDGSIDNEIDTALKSTGDPTSRTASPSVANTHFEHSNTQKEDVDQQNTSVDSNSFLHPIIETQNDLLDRAGSSRVSPSELSDMEFHSKKEKKMSLFKIRNDEEFSDSQRSLDSQGLTNAQQNDDLPEFDMRISVAKRLSAFKDREEGYETPLEMESQVTLKNEEDTIS